MPQVLALVGASLATWALVTPGHQPEAAFWGGVLLGVSLIGALAQGLR